LIYEEDKLSECHPIIEENGLRIGNIYLGRVQKKLKNIDSAFVSLDGENIGYLPLNDKPALVLNRKLPNGLATIAENDIVLVQVEQEPQKMKQARVTGNVSISGQYVALDINEGSIGVSRRIKDEEIIKHLRGLIKTDERFGLIYRTACENAEDNEIINEYEKLSKTLKDIIDNATYERKTGLIYSQKPEYISILEDYGLGSDLSDKQQKELYNKLTGG
jgi:ribonuclease G